MDSAILTQTGFLRAAREGEGALSLLQGDAAWKPTACILHLPQKGGKMGTFNTHHFTGPLTEEFHDQLEGLGTHGTMDLNDFVR